MSETSERSTYNERQSYSARVMRFRKAVYAANDDMTNGCRVMLLRLSDEMDAKCIVSVPRSRLAADLGVAPARITEWVSKAKALGFLDTVRRGRPGVTAVYQGLRGHATDSLGTPQSTNERYARADHVEVRPDVPTTDPTWYALGGSQVEDASSNGTAATTGEPNDSSEEEYVMDLVSFLAAEPSPHACPHGIENGDQPDPFDEVFPHEPQCPACRFDVIQPKPKRERKSA